jgi:hypothetical protein
MALLRPCVFLLALLVIADRAIGGAFEYLYFQTRSGEGGGQINAALTTPAQVLLVGSSRMKHHADTGVLARRLATSVYNAGINGHDFLYAAMLLDVRLHAADRPRVVVLHVDPDSFSHNPIELSRARIFAYYLDRSAIVRRVLFEDGWAQRSKYLSLTYRANGKALPIIKNVVIPSNTSDGGFEPLNGSMQLPAVAPPRLDATFWAFKLSLFNDLVQLCRATGTTLILVNSPTYFVTGAEREQHDRWRSALRRLLDAYPDVPFLEINSVTCPAVFDDPGEYRDSSHLNSRGARIYSELLADEVDAALHTRPGNSGLFPTPVAGCSPARLLRAAVNGSKDPNTRTVDLKK